jgi:hypothetical protein
MTAPDRIGAQVVSVIFKGLSAAIILGGLIALTSELSNHTLTNKGAIATSIIIATVVSAASVLFFAYVLDLLVGIEARLGSAIQAEDFDGGHQGEPLGNARTVTALTDHQPMTTAEAQTSNTGPASPPLAIFHCPWCSFERQVDETSTLTKCSHCSRIFVFVECPECHTPQTVQINTRESCRSCHKRLPSSLSMERVAMSAVIGRDT